MKNLLLFGILALCLNSFGQNKKQQIVALNYSIDSLNALLSTINLKASRDIEELNRTIKARKKEISELTNDLSELESSVPNLEKDKSKLTNENQKLKTELDEISMKIFDLKMKAQNMDTSGFANTTEPIVYHSLLQEIVRTFDNGQPEFIDYRESDSLKKVKTEQYNEEGKLVFSIQFNPNTGLPDGAFYDLINKGYFNNGELNCENCMLIESAIPSVNTYNYKSRYKFITKGNVVNGRLVGEVKRYEIYEYDPSGWSSWYGGNLNYARSSNQSPIERYSVDNPFLNSRRFEKRESRTGELRERLIDSKNYNENGLLYGEVFLTNQTWSVRLNVTNGIVRSYITFDEYGNAVDSLSNRFKIWKRNGKYEKNSGFVIFRAPELLVQPPTYGEDYMGDEWYDGMFLSRGNDSYEAKNEDWLNSRSSSLLKKYNYVIISPEHPYWGVIGLGSKPQGLNQNGLYAIYRNSMFDHIMSYGADPFHQIHQNNFKMNNQKNDNLFVGIYDYLKNNNESILNKGFQYQARDYFVDEEQDKLSEFGIILMASSLPLEDPNFIERITVGRYVEKNAFSKYCNSSYFKANKLYGSGVNYSLRNSYGRFPYELKIPSGSYTTIKEIFKYLLSLKDYLKACQESIEKGHTSIQEIWVWNSVSSNYEKVNFNLLIQLANKK